MASAPFSVVRRQETTISFSPLSLRRGGNNASCDLTGRNEVGAMWAQGVGVGVERRYQRIILEFSLWSACRIAPWIARHPGLCGNDH